MPDRPPFESMTTEQLSEWCSMDANRPGNYPLTLDGADAAMPEGWRLSVQQRDDGTWAAEAFFWKWVRVCNDPLLDMHSYKGPKHEIGVADNEIDARFRLDCECRWAERSNP